MNFTMNNIDYSEKTYLILSNTPANNESSRPNLCSHQCKPFEPIEILEICCLIFILLEHTCIFLITFRRKSLKRIPSDRNQYSVLLPLKSFLYSCLHRNWIRAFSFSNMCLSVVYFVLLMLKHFHPNLVHYSSTTLYSLPLNLLKQININFSTFHLFIIAISVLQYFLRYYRLYKNTYSTYFFDGQNLLLTQHTNVALILSGSLALIFGYNFVFYNPTESPTISFLPLITFNMILLPLINFLILLFILICLVMSFVFETNFDNLSVNDDEQENLRLIIEKSTCIKCYSKILEKNPNLFQDQNYLYRNLYQNFFSTNLRSTYPFQIKRDSFSSKRNTSPRIDLSHQHENSFLNQRTLTKLNHQHSLCHLCYYLLLIFLLKYILLTFPENLIQMYLYSKHFHHFILKKDPNTTFNHPLYENYKYLLQISHFLFLSSRFADSFFLIRLPYLIKKYFPCWCQFNSRLLRRQQTSHQILTKKNSDSSNNEPIPPTDQIISNERDQHQESIEHRRFRLQFQFIPLWSRNRPRLFRESV